MSYNFGRYDSETQMYCEASAINVERLRFMRHQALSGNLTGDGATPMCSALSLKAADMDIVPCESVSDPCGICDRCTDR